MRARIGEKNSCFLGEPEVWEIRLYDRKERDCSEGTEVLHFDCGSTQHSFFPFDSNPEIGHKCKSTLDELRRQGTVSTREEERPEAERGCTWAAILE